MNQLDVGFRAVRLAAAAGLAAALAVAAPGLGQQRQTGFASPVALAALASGDLIVLESGRGIVRFDPRTGRRLPLVSHFPGFLPTDVVSTSDERIFVSLRRSLQSGGAVSRVLSFDVDGKELGKVSFVARSFFVGMAVDPSRGIAYLTAARSGEIAAVSLADGKLSTLLTVPGVAILAALTIDAAGERLFAADSGRGTLHLVQPLERSSELLAEGLGEPGALAFDRRRERVYVADSAADQIWIVELRGSPPRAELFAKHPGLRRPRGLAVTADGTLWVASHDSGQLLAFSPDAELVSSVP